MAESKEKCCPEHTSVLELPTALLILFLPLLLLVVRQYYYEHHWHYHYSADCRKLLESSERHYRTMSL
jgi:hypothetical protein